MQQRDEVNMERYKNTAIENALNAIFKQMENGRPPKGGIDVMVYAIKNLEVICRADGDLDTHWDDYKLSIDKFTTEELNKVEDADKRLFELANHKLYLLLSYQADKKPKDRELVI